MGGVLPDDERVRPAAVTDRHQFRVADGGIMPAVGWGRHARSWAGANAHGVRRQEADVRREQEGFAGFRFSRHLSETERRVVPDHRFLTQRLTFFGNPHIMGR